MKQSAFKRGMAAVWAICALLGATPATGTPEEFAAFFAAERSKWEAVVKTVGISID